MAELTESPDDTATSTCCSAMSIPRAPASLTAVKTRKFRLPPSKSTASLRSIEARALRACCETPTRLRSRRAFCPKRFKGVSVSPSASIRNAPKLGSQRMPEIRRPHRTLKHPASFTGGPEALRKARNQPHFDLTLPQGLPHGLFSPFLRFPKNAKTRLISGFSSYSGGGIRTRDLRVMSPNQGSRWTTWGTVSSGFREIELRWDRLRSVGRVAPFVAPALAELRVQSSRDQTIEQMGRSN
jgi:hypothetical protein